MSLPDDGASTHGNRRLRTDERPPLRPARLLLSLLVSAASVFLAAAILPGFDVGDFAEALLAALLIGALNAFSRHSSQRFGSRTRLRRPFSCSSF